MILLIDNYDSFVYNLARYVSELGFARVVKRNDEISIDEIVDLNPSHIIISPGPCTPNEAGITLDVIGYFAGKIPLLGVCLGHQAMGQVFGGDVVRAQKPMHGKASLVHHDGKNIFKSLPNPLCVARYHSLIVDEKNLQEEITVTSRSLEGEVMSLAHNEFALVGVQFHPESVLTNFGYELLQNFLEMT